MIIRVAVNIKLKNPVEVLHFQKIQVRLNVSRICTPKLREKGISRKHLVLDQKQKKRIYNNLWIYVLSLFEEVRHEISLVCQFLVTFTTFPCKFLLKSGRHEICLN